MNRTRVLQAALYPVDLIDATEREFASLCSVRRQTTGEGVEITIVPVRDAPFETSDEFLNFLLSASLERRLSS